MVDLARLRDDFREVLGWCINCGEWTEAEAAEIGQGIKAAVDAQNLGELAFWAEWMGKYEEMVRTDIACRVQLEANALAKARHERGLHETDTDR